MITFYYDESKQTPMYEQLYQYLKEAIEKKELKPNEKLPSKRRLASHLQLSETTIETAYLQLLAEGYIRSQPRVGYFVLDHLSFPKRRKDIENIETRNEASYHYDFKTNQVDASAFPYRQFGKLSRDVILDQLENSLNQTQHFGLYALREKIADILFAYRGIEALPEQIVIGSGSEHMISLLVLLLGRDKHIVTEDPTYKKNVTLYQEYGAHISVSPIDESGIVLDKVRKLKADVIHIAPSHQFPSGIITPISRRIAILNWASESEERYIVEDDYDSEFRFSGNPIPALKVLDEYDKVIYMNSFSKSISPGLRVSFMVLPRKLVKRYYDLFSYFSCSVPVTTQLILKSFIESGQFEKHLNRMKILYKSKRDLLVQELRKAFGDKIIIKGDDAGLHFLGTFICERTEKEMIELAKLKQIRVYGLSEFHTNNASNEKFPTFVFGYSHLSINSLQKVVILLKKAWSIIFTD